MIHRALASLAARFAALLLASAMLLAPVLGDVQADRLALDSLFEQLRVAADARAAREIDHQIWTLWTTPSDPDLAAAMAEALAARSAGDLSGAIGLLSGLIETHPDYAEAWNQRATMYFLVGNDDASLADIEQVLVREPRHFGALSGQALIYLKQGKRALAVKSMAAALAIHPFLPERSLFPELFEDATRI